jgi:FkbH-like protein
MRLLEYVRLANTYTTPAEPDLRIAIVTNFTGDLLAKLITGRCLAEGLQPSVYQVPFKQYLFDLKNPKSELSAGTYDVTFIFFDANPYLESEFGEPGHVSEVIRDIEKFCKMHSGAVVIQLLSLPSRLQHDRLLRDHALAPVVQEFTTGILELSKSQPNVYAIDTDRLVRLLGEDASRDFRGLYAFAQPFTNDFLYAVTQEWMAYVRTLRGALRKCIVLDLDNTLWGGVVGEAGVHGIELGPTYPGNAYREFQRTLLELYNRGVILAINSRNNPEDVDEAFEKNSHMILKKEHFAAIVTNWENKADNLRTIAKELNIGLDSLVFIDDDPVNRELVRLQAPEVAVPEWSFPPEEYVRELLDLDALHSLRLTDEDRERGRMYAEERQRKAMYIETQTPEEYLAALGVEITVALNDPKQVTRAAQLTQKTNQFNLTTRRSTEKEVADWMTSGSYVYTGDVRDKFGSYGITVLAIVHPKNTKEAEVGTFLMSCRVMGRNVEKHFLENVLHDLHTKGYETVHATFIRTAKNAPAQDFLSRVGGLETSKEESGTIQYTFNLKNL